MDGHALLPILLLAGGALLIAAIVIVSWRIERKRQEALAGEASRLRLSYNPGKSHDLARQYKKLRGLNEGEDRYAFDILAGDYHEQRITAFDFHHETHSTDSKGNRSTTHHYQNVFLLHLEREFPNLLISPENILSKIAQAFGYDDIDFESHEFSRRFCVRSPDKRFAYDFCNSAMIKFLLQRPSLNLEVHGDVLAFVFAGKLNPSDIEQKLTLACSVHKRMPAYLFAA